VSQDYRVVVPDWNNTTMFYSPITGTADVFRIDHDGGLAPLGAARAQQELLCDMDFSAFCMGFEDVPEHWVRSRQANRS
jgi:hypothetical protein